MFEVLSIRPPMGEVIEDTGAGESMLVNGDANFGYFGSFPESQIGVTPGLRDMLSEIGINISVDPSNVRWFKFIRQGKVLLYPNMPLAQLSYVNLEEIGATYAKSDMETPEALSKSVFTDATLMTENPIVSAGQGSKYRVRLFNTVVGAKATTNQVTTDGSEFKDMVTDVFSGDSSIGLKLPLSQFVTSRFLIQECIDATYTGSMNYNGVIGGVSGYAKSNWIPVLEYIPPGYLSDNLVTPQNLILGSNVTASAPILEETEAVSNVIAVSAPWSDNPGFTEATPSITTDGVNSIQYPLIGSIGVPDVADSEQSLYGSVPYAGKPTKEESTPMEIILPATMYPLVSDGVRSSNIQTTPILD